MKFINITFTLLSAAPLVAGADIEQARATNPHLRGKHVEEAATGSSSSSAAYKYSIETDCYKEGVECPAGTFCQVEERDNWYPFDVSYINRGRCLSYAPLGGSCEVPFDGVVSFPRKADGKFFERSTLCAPDATCTGEHIFVMPATCVVARDPRQGCMTTERNGCSGRPKDEVPNDDSFCFFPPAEKKSLKTTVEVSEAEYPGPGTTRMDKNKLEQCATILTSFDGPVFAFAGAGGTLPDDTHIASGGTEPMTKHSILHGSRMAKNVQKILKTLWPYPICGDEGPSDDCTSFPLPVPSRDDDGGLYPGKCLVYVDDGSQEQVNCTTLDSPIDMSFLLEGSSNGVIDYLCTWATLHTLSFNGNAVLTAAEKRGFGELIVYISGQFDCKVCRNNFANIVKIFGMPEGHIREDYARWLWQAHNNANEHSYATHSLAGTRTPEWSHPKYEHPWYTTFEDAISVWTGLEGFPSQY